MKTCLSPSNDCADQAIILEINFGSAGNGPVDRNHLLWAMLAHITNGESPACVVLVSETSMWQATHSGAYLNFLQTLTALFSKTTLFYYGKEVDNTLDVDQAKFLNCLPVTSWQNGPIDVAKKITNARNLTWYCFSHRMSSSALFRKIVERNIFRKLSMSNISAHIFAPDDVSRYFDCQSSQEDIKIIAALSSALIANTSKEMTFCLLQAVMNLLKDNRSDSSASLAWSGQLERATDSINRIKESSSSKSNRYEVFVSSPRVNPYEVFVNASPSYSTARFMGCLEYAVPHEPSGSLASFNSPLVRSRKYLLKSEATGCDKAVFCRN